MTIRKEKGVMSAIGRLIAGTMMIAGLVHATPSQAQEEFPSRSIEVVVPFSGAAATDALARVFAEGLSAVVDQPVVVLNRPGANGLVAVNYAKSQPTDGHTMLFMPPSIVVDQAMSKEPKIDVTEEMIAVSRIIDAPLGFFVSKDTPADSLEELVSYLKSVPGERNFATSGVGSFAHLNTELFFLNTGTEMVHIPYPAGTGAILTALLSGEVDVFVNELSSMKSYVDEGQIKVLAVLGNQRSPLYPDTPAITEVGIPELENAFLSIYFGVFTVAGVPDDRIEQLAAKIDEAVSHQETIERFNKMGYADNQIGGSTQEEFQGIVNTALTNFQTVVREANIEKR